MILELSLSINFKFFSGFSFTHNVFSYEYYWAFKYIFVYSMRIFFLANYDKYFSNQIFPRNKLILY